MSLQDIYEQNIHTVVSITTTHTGGSSTGTGVILTTDGYLVTNQLYYLEREDKYYYFYEDGTMASDTLLNYQGDMIYLGPDGDQKFSTWIGSDAEGWRYLNSEGQQDGSGCLL